MPLTPNLPAAILETILSGITTLFLAGANGDATVARQAATELLTDYRPQNAAELSLAATIISCGFRSLDILVQASATDLPIPAMLRLHGSAVSLSREAAKAQRHLALLQKERKQTRPAQPVQFEPDPAPAPQPVQEAPARPLGPIAAFAKERGITWSKAYQERERERRIAASLKRAEAKVAASNAPTAAAAVSPEPAAAT
jgi:hypothetical protein